MAKDTFVLYTEFYGPLRTLSLEQKGKLFDAMFKFHLEDGNVSVDEDIQVAFGFLENQFRRDWEKWEAVCKARGEAGRKGMQSRWGKDITNDNKNNKSYQAITKITDNDNEDENVNDNESKKKRRFVPPTLTEVEEYCKERSNSINAQGFIDYYESIGWKIGDKPMRSWQAAIRTWERREAAQKPQKPSGKVITNIKDLYDE